MICRLLFPNIDYQAHYPSDGYEAFMIAFV